MMKHIVVELVLNVADDAIVTEVLWFLLFIFSRISSECFFFLQEYDDGYGAAYDDQGFESYDNNYNNQGQK